MPIEMAKKLEEICTTIGVSTSVVIRALVQELIDGATPLLNEEVLRLIRARAEGPAYDPNALPGTGLSLEQVLAIIDASPPGTFEPNPVWSGFEWVPVPAGKAVAPARPLPQVLEKLKHPRKRWGSKALTRDELLRASPFLAGLRNRGSRRREGSAPEQKDARRPEEHL